MEYPEEINPEEAEEEEDMDVDEDADLAEVDEEEYKERRNVKFGQRPVTNEPQTKIRLHEVKTSFYNRLESVRLIKKQGRIPFTEHMTI